MSSPTAASLLEERHGGFDYDYRMNCECGRSSYLSAEDYYDELNEARMFCEHCGESIHFGRAVAALRDAADPALANGRINSMVWYHTGTSPDWPSTIYADEVGAKLTSDEGHLIHDVDAYINRLRDQALHVGTYQSAIENMLRRMNDQDDATNDFYLHRIELSVDPDRVNEGYRDENHEQAAQISATDIRADGLTAVRYLNVFEDVGSLSLAVVPEAIAWVQSVRLPVQRLAPVHSDTLVSILDEAQSRLDEERATASAESASGLIGRRSALLDRIKVSESYATWDSVISTLARHYLVGISPMVRDQFENAISAWHREQAVRDVRVLADHYAASAVALTQFKAVAALLTAQVPRAVATSPADRPAVNGHAAERCDGA